MMQKKSSKERFVINKQKPLGNGSFGWVYEGHDLVTNRKIAIKTQDPAIANAYQNEIKREISVLFKIKHPRVMELQGYKISGGEIFLYLELCTGGTLKQYLRKQKNKCLPEKEAFRIFKMIVDTFVEVTKMGIIHRDLKPDNIFLNEKGEIKIGDFGLARVMEADVNVPIEMTKCGTFVQSSPQVIIHESYSSKCDVWSAGIILQEMIYGRIPFSSRNEHHLARMIYDNTGTRDIELPHHPVCTEPLKKVIQKTLSYNEEDRPSWEELGKMVNEIDAIYNLNPVIVPLQNPQEAKKNQDADHNSVEKKKGEDKDKRSIEETNKFDLKRSFYRNRKRLRVTDLVGNSIQGQLNQENQDQLEGLSPIKKDNQLYQNCTPNDIDSSLVQEVYSALSHHIDQAILVIQIAEYVHLQLNLSEALKLCLDLSLGSYQQRTLKDLHDVLDGTGTLDSISDKALKEYKEHTTCQEMKKRILEMVQSAKQLIEEIIKFAELRANELANDSNKENNNDDMLSQNVGSENKKHVDELKSCLTNAKDSKIYRNTHLEHLEVLVKENDLKQQFSNAADIQNNELRAIYGLIILKNYQKKFGGQSEEFDFKTFQDDLKSESTFDLLKLILAILKE